MWRRLADEARGMITAGLDTGSRAIKLVLVEKGVALLQKSIETSFDYLEQVRCLLHGLEYHNILVTGYGRHLVAREIGLEHVTEIKAHAAGVHHLLPTARGVIDIGGQDTKAISMDGTGKVCRFEMNDRCAAGTGRFLEVMAMALGREVAELSELAAQGREGISLNSMCTVFVETEVVARRAQGASPADVARALVKSVAQRTASMAKRVLVDEKADIAFCGGVARNDTLASFLSEALGRPVLVPPGSEFTGALGAAVLAAKRI